MADFIPIGEAAKYLGISRDTLRRWEKAGKLKAQRSPTNRRYYTKEQLDQLIGKQSAPKKKVETKKAGKETGIIKTVGFGLVGFIIAALIAFITIAFLMQ